MWSISMKNATFFYSTMNVALCAHAFLSHHFSSWGKSSKYQKISTPYHTHGLNGLHQLYTTSTSRSHLDDIESIYVISDLHTDNVENLHWLRDRCEGKVRSEHLPTPNDALIIAGDISHDLSRLEETLSILVKNLNCHVFFVWGNHEAWIGGREMDSRGIKDSLQKIEIVKELCSRFGVYTDFQLVGRAKDNPAFILPIESWYDATLSLRGCEDLCDSFNSWPWVDFIRCEWPDEHTLKEWLSNAKELGKDVVYERGHLENTGRIPIGLTEWFALQNFDSIQQIQNLYDKWKLDMGKSESNNYPFSYPGLITFSHFLPNNKTLPDWKEPSEEIFLRDEWLDHPIPNISAKFAKVSGSKIIDEQIRSIILPSNETARLHVFGHSHRPKDFVYDGIRYIHNPLGKPAERDMNMVSREVDFQLIWNCSRSDAYLLEYDLFDKNMSFLGGTGEVPGSKTIRFWEEQGGGKKALQRNMRHRKIRRRLEVKRFVRDVKKTKLD